MSVGFHESRGPECQDFQVIKDPKVIKENIVNVSLILKINTTTQNVSDKIMQY